MIVRPLDADGDMMPVHSLDQMIDGAEAVAQVIHLRLDLEHGEWWEDEDLGLRVPEFLINGARRGDTDMMAKYIASYVSNTEGVSAVTNVAAAYSNHMIIFSCAAVMDNGDEAVVEVDVSGIL